MDYVVRFVAGGLIVSAFAILGDVLRPKSFAGLFGAAPSIALATLTMATFKEGSAYVSIEGRSMILGAIALSLYCVVVCQLLMRFRFSAFTATGCAAGDRQVGVVARIDKDKADIGRGLDLTLPRRCEYRSRKNKASIAVGPCFERSPQVTDALPRQHAHADLFR
jgi:hypothetical protein